MAILKKDSNDELVNLDCSSDRHLNPGWGREWKEVCLVALSDISLD